jgi:hypothetical protein
MQRYPATRFNQRFPPIQFQFTQNQPVYEDYTSSQYRQSSQAVKTQSDFSEIFNVIYEKNSKCMNNHSKGLRNSHSTGTLEIIKNFESKSKKIEENMKKESKILKNRVKYLEKECSRIKSDEISRTESILKLFSELKSNIKLLKHSKVIQSKNEKRKPPQSIRPSKKSKCII